MTITEERTSSAAPAEPERNGHRMAVAIAVLVALVAAAIAVPLALRRGAPSARPVTVQGWAYADQPLQNTTMTIRTIGGRTVVRNRADATTAAGTFNVSAKLPPSFRLTVADGTAGGQLFTGHLVADVYNYGPKSPPIQVNPITTLTAAYRDKHPNLSQAQAAAAVQRFLVLPAGVDVGMDLRGNDQWFSPKQFMTQATAAGGVLPFVAMLVAEMDATPPKTHAFVGEAHNALANDVVGGIVGRLAGIGFGYALNSIGIGQPVPAEVLDALNQIKAQLTQLQVSVNQVIGLVTQQSFDTAAAQVIPIKNAVMDAFDRLKIAADSGDQGMATDAAQLIDGLFASNALRNMHSALYGEGTTGAYLALSNVMRSKVTFWTPATAKQLKDYFTYYDNVQLQLILMLRERAQLKGISQAAFDLSDMAVYNTNRDLQLAKANSFDVPKAPVDLRTNFMWPTAIGGQPARTWPTEVPDTVAAYNGTKCGVTLQNPCVQVGPLFGFADWRVPKDTESAALVAGHANARDWLRAEWGGDPNILRSCYTFCSNITQIWTNERVTGSVCGVFGSGKVPYRALNLDTGKLENRCMDDPTYVWPVRNLTANEKYWLT